MLQTKPTIYFFLRNSRKDVGRVPSEAEINSAHLSGLGASNHSCATDYATGVIVNLQPRQGMSDDAAITNVKFKCKDGEIVGTETDYNVGDVYEFKLEDSCGKNQAICGAENKV